MRRGRGGEQHGYSSAPAACRAQNNVAMTDRCTTTSTYGALLASLRFAMKNTTPGQSSSHVLLVLACLASAHGTYSLPATVDLFTLFLKPAEHWTRQVPQIPGPYLVSCTPPCLTSWTATGPHINRWGPTFTWPKGCRAGDSIWGGGFPNQGGFPCSLLLCFCLETALNTIVQTVTVNSFPS